MNFVKNITIVKKQFIIAMLAKEKIMYMVKKYERIVMKAVALCYKPFLKPEEAMIYCNLGRTQLSKRCEDFGVYKNDAGYYKREDLDRLLSGAVSTIEEQANQIELRFR